MLLLVMAILSVCWSCSSSRVKLKLFWLSLLIRVVCLFMVVAVVWFYLGNVWFWLFRMVAVRFWDVTVC